MFQFQGSYPSHVESRGGPIPQGIYEQSVTPNGVLGVVRRVGGRTFVYSKDSGGGQSRGKLSIAATPTAAHQNVVAQAAAVVGATVVNVTLGATLASLNQYADGYLCITDEDSQGVAYKIRRNPAAALSTTLEISLYDALTTALTTSSECCLVPNRWNGNVISIADQDDTPNGVPLIAITASYYYWSQTGGPASVLADETIEQGAEVTIGSSTVGAVEAKDSAEEPLVGVAIIAGVDDEYRPVYLKILE